MSSIAESATSWRDRLSVPVLVVVLTLGTVLWVRWVDSFGSLAFGLLVWATADWIDGRRLREPPTDGEYRERQRSNPTRMVVLFFAATLIGVNVVRGAGDASLWSTCLQVVIATAAAGAGVAAAVRLSDGR